MKSRYGLEIRTAASADTQGLCELLQAAGHVITPREMAERLHVPFQVLSDSDLALTRALNLPTMGVLDLTLIKRMALIIDDATITHVFYPVFPPDRNAGDVLAWLQANPR